MSYVITAVVFLGLGYATRHWQAVWLPWVKKQWEKGR